MEKNARFKKIKILAVLFVLLSSFMVANTLMKPANAASQFTLGATPTPRVEVPYDAGSTANVSNAAGFVAAVQNTSIKRIVMTQPITLATADVTDIRGVTLNRSLQIDGNGFKLTHGSGDVFKLSNATQATTFHLKNMIIEKISGANASNLVYNGNGLWDILFEDVTINTGVKYAHVIDGATNPSLFFRGDCEFMMHQDDFAQGIGLVVFEDNSIFSMNESAAGGTNFWNHVSPGTAIVHFGEDSVVDIKGNASWGIFYYFKEYYVHKNADVYLYKDSAAGGVLTSYLYPSSIQIDSGSKFILENLDGPAYGDQNYLVTITSNPGAHIEFIGKKATAGGGVDFDKATSKLIIDSPKYFNIENKNTAIAAFKSSSTTNQALQILNTDIGAWNKGVATVPPTSPFPFNGATLFAGNTTALAGTTPTTLASTWNSSNYSRIAKSTRPTISSTDLSLGINRTKPIVSTYTPSDATLTYASSNNGVASVDSNGVVTGVSAGTATITITATNPESIATSTTITVTITNTPPVLTVPGFTQINVNDSFNPLTGVSATDAEDGPITTINVTPTSINTAVAGVYPLTYSVTDSDGNITTKTRVVLVNGGAHAVGTNYILSASNFTKAIDQVDTSDATIKADAQVKLYDKATGALSAGTVNVTNKGGYNATVGTYNITFAAASEPTLTKTITATVSATAQKTAAKAELDAKATELRAAIDALPGLSASEKTAAKTAINNELNQAKTNVDAATTINDITAAKNAGILAMTQIFDTQKSKSDQTILNARNSLDQTATDLIAAIESLPGLDPGQIFDGVTEMDVALGVAKGNVDAATDLTGISSAVTNGESEMIAIYNYYKSLSDQAIADAKTAAIAELNQKATEIRTAINNVEGATQADKENARADLDAVLAAGIASVNNATTFAEITTEKDLSLAAMDEVLVELQERVNDALRIEKEAAVATLDTKLAEAKAAVNALANLSPAEKAAAIQDLDDAYLVAEEAINDATNTSEITSALNNGIRAFDAIVVDATLQDAKNLAVTALQQKAADIKAAIDALPGLNAQEKLDGKAAVDAELGTGTTNINAATTPTFVQGALNVSRATMDQIYVDLAQTSAAALVTAKADAIAELTQAADDAKALIDALPNLDAGEKAALKADVDASLATATTAINDAADLIEVATELNNGIFAIEANVQEAQLLDLKNAAIAELNTKADEANARIDALGNLDDDEKAAAKALIANELANAITSVNSATTAIEIEDFVIDAGEAFNRVVQDATVLNEQNRAKEELAAKALNLKGLIDLLPGLTQAERDTAKAAIDTELITGSAAIDAATSIGGVLSALDTSKAAMDAIYDNVSAISAQVLADAKTAAVADLQTAADAARAAIDALTNLTIEEKTAAKNAVTADLNAAITAVNGATTLGDVTIAKDNGVIAINANVTEAQLLDAKSGAIAELEDRAEQIKADIDALVGLSAADKTAAKNAVDAARDLGIADVQAATSIPDVLTAQTTADAAMDKILSDLEASLAQELADAKTAAITELENRATQAIADIDALTTLSASEKQAAKDAIATALTDATTAVNSATTVAEVTTAKDTGITTMDNIVNSATLSDAKLTAIAELEAKAAAVKAAIDALPGLTTQEKIDGKAAIDAELNTGITNINAATNVTGVETAKDNSIEAMDTILADLVVINNEALAADKAAANAALDDAAQAAKDAIDALGNLSDEEKATAKAAVDTALTTAKTAVADATTTTGIADAKNLGLVAIQEKLDVAVLLDAKNAAKAVLEQGALDAIAEINLLTNLTPEEKTAALDQIAAQKAAAITAIDEATTLSRVTDAKDDGIEDMQQTVLDAQLLDAKNAASASLEAKAQEVIDAINALPGLTDAEKEAAVLEIEAELTNGLANIAAGTTPAEINTALTDSVAIMDGILSDLVAQSEAAIDAAKVAAITDLQNAAQAAKDAIDGLGTLSDAEKTAAKNAIDAELAAAITAVESATNPTEIETALTEGTDAINQIVKDAAIAVLEKKAADVKAAIDALPGLTDEEKAAGKTLVDAELVLGRAAINSATTPAGISGALATSSTNMDNILFGLTNSSNQVILEAKQAALTELDANAAAAKAIINALPNLSPAERAAAIADVDNALATAKQAVADATTPTEIGVVLNAGNANIAAVAVDAQVLDAKNGSTAALEQKAADVKAAIDALPGLTAQEKIDGKAAIDAELAIGLAAIDNGTTVLEIRAAETTSAAEMDEIYLTLGGISANVVAAAKDAATAELNRNAEDARRIINELPNLTPEERAAAIAEVDNNLAVAIQDVNNATSPSDVATALNTGNAAIAGDVVDSQVQDAKNDAKAALEQKALDVKAAIDALPGLTDAEKAAGKALIDAELTNGLAAIEAGTSVLEVRAAGTTSGAAMDQVLSDLLDQSNEVMQAAKNDAIAELQGKATGIKNAIDAMPGLSDEERVAAKQAIDEALARGILAINAGTTLDEITVAKTAAKEEMASVLSKPVIIAPIFTEIKIKDGLDLLAGVSAHDLQDGDITPRISVQGTVDPNKAGVYVVTYTVADLDGNSTSATRVFLVNDGTYVVDNNLIITAEDFQLYEDEINKTDAEFIKLANVRVYNVLTQEWMTDPTITVNRSQVQGKAGVYKVTFTHNPSVSVELTILSRNNTNGFPLTGDSSNPVLFSMLLVLAGASLVAMNKKKYSK